MNLTIGRECTVEGVRVRRRVARAETNSRKIIARLEREVGRIPGAADLTVTSTFVTRIQ